MNSQPQSKTTTPEPKAVKRIGAREARNHFADLLGTVYYSGEPVIIERSGKPMAVLVSIEQYEQSVLPAASQAMGTRRTLFGAFPELAALAEADFDQAKKEWSQSIDRQLEILRQGE